MLFNRAYNKYTRLNVLSHSKEWAFILLTLHRVRQIIEIIYYFFQTLLKKVVFTVVILALVVLI